MGFLPWVVRRSDQGQRPKPVLLLNACFLKPGRLDGRSHLDLLAVYAFGVGSGLEAMD